MFLTQSKYVLDLLKPSNTEQAKSCPTLAIMCLQLSSSSGPKLNNEKSYQNTVRALQYFTNTQVEISYIVIKLGFYIVPPICIGEVVNEFWHTCMGVLIVVCTINQLLDSVSLASQMLIGLVVSMNEGPPMASMFFLVLTLSHGVHVSKRLLQGPTLSWYTKHWLMRQ